MSSARISSLFLVLRKRLWVGIVVAMALLAAESLFQAGSLNGLDRAYGDLWYRLMGVQSAPSRVVLIKLDEATLATHPDEPLAFWGPHFAQACAVLRQAGVRLIGIDFLFSASPERWLARLGEGSSLAARQFDQDFRQELATGQIVLAGAQSPQETLLPATEYLVAIPDLDIGAHVGAADLLPDGDGTLRHIRVMPPVDGVAPPPLHLLSFPVLLAIRASNQSPKNGLWHFGTQTLVPDSPPITLAYAGPPGTTPSLSMSVLLTENALNNPAVQALKDKVVIIGASYGGNNDLHMTPYGRGFFDAPLMLGSELQAQTVEALLDGRFLSRISSTKRILLTLLLALPLALTWVRLRPLTGLLVLLGSFLGVSLVAASAFRFLLAFPAAPVQFALLFTSLGIYGWRLTHGERERARLRRIFSRYVSPQVVDALIKSPRPPQLGGESLEVTVLFSDIRSFTTLSEMLSPQEVVEILNAYFEQACAIMTEAGGCIDKFIGDAIMVEFGAPLPQPDHARRALRAALGLSALSSSFRSWMQARFPGRDLPEFTIGTGIHTGLAVVGNIGSSLRMEYTSIGDTVNLASRLESMTKTLACPILASRATVMAAGPGVQLGQQATITVKGRHESVDVFEILGLEEVPHAA